MSPPFLPTMSFGNLFHDSNHRPRDQYNSVKLASNSSSTKAAYTVLISILFYYVFQYFNPTGLQVVEVLWNVTVWITPSRLIARLDSGFDIAVMEEKKYSEAGFKSRKHARKSIAMRHILSLDGAEASTDSNRKRALSKWGAVSEVRSDSYLPGLGNRDNSCYQNSVLQGLAALESLPAFLNQNMLSDVSSGISQPTTSALSDFIARLNDPANVGTTLWAPTQLSTMSSWQQQDAQEYFSKISYELEKDASKGFKQKFNRKGLEKLLYQAKEVTSSSMSQPDSTRTTEICISKIPRASSLLSQLPDELASLVVRNPLEGLLAQRVGCQRCGFVEGLSLVPFNCLTVPLGRNRLYEIGCCLDDYTALEPISGVECAKCTLLGMKQSLEEMLSEIRRRLLHGDQASLAWLNDSQILLGKRLELVDKALEDEDYSDQALKRCLIPKERVSTTKTRQAVIARVPRSLVIHINRSNFDEVTGMQSKNRAIVSFPRRLDLAPWCLGHNPEPYDKDTTVESWNTDPSKSMLSDHDFGNPDAHSAYQLRAVITHAGLHENGHYVCYRKSPYFNQNDDMDVDGGDDSWWRLSDDHVTRVSEAHVLAEGGVFMLFYEQSATDLHPQRDELSSQHVKEEEMSVASAEAEAESEKLPVLEEFSLSNASPADFTAMPVNNALPTLPPTPPEPHQTTKTTPSVNVLESMSKADPVDTVDTVNDLPSENATTLHPVDLSQSFQQQEDSSLPSPDIRNLEARAPEHDLSIKPSKDNQPISPAAMRTASPRHNRGSVSRAGKAMGSVAGFVQAN